MLRPMFCLLLTWSALVLVGNHSIQGGEQEFIDLVRRSERIVIGVPAKTVNLRETGGVQVRVERALRGPGVKGETLKVAHDGSESTPKFEGDQQYLLLLRPNPEASGWVNIGSQAMPNHDGSFLIGAAADSAISLESIQGIIDKNPASADTLLPVRDTPGGRWLVSFTMQKSKDSTEQVDLPLGILDLKKQDEGYSAELIAIGDEFSEAKLTDFSMEGETVHFTLDVVSAPTKVAHQFDFNGRFDEGAMWGNISADQQPAMLAKMNATSALSMEQTNGPQPLAGQDVLNKAIEAEDEYAAYQKFVEDYSYSPLALQGYLRMLGSESTARFDEQQIRELTQEFLKASERWGERIKQKSIIEAAMALSHRKAHPKLALEVIEQAEPLLDDANAKYWEEAVMLQKPLMLWEAGDQDQAIELMLKYRKKHPFNAISNYHLAQMYEEQGKIDEALTLYAELVALPNMKDLVDSQFESQIDYMPLLDKLDKLWRGKYGDRKALPAFTYNVYYQAIQHYTDEKVKPREPKPGLHNRVALMELLTGAPCPTCVAADLASGILEQIYPKTELIGIRYHLHTAGPDPMASPASDQRFAYYDGKGIPTVAINGKTFRGGGYIMHVESMLERYRETVDEVLSETVDIELKLSSIAKDGIIHISAEALRPEAFEGDVRLRIVLAEERLLFSASNGILLHDNVVRRMIEGEKGIAPQEGKLEYQGEVSLKEYRTDLNNYLTNFEDFNSNQTGKEFKFENRPIGPLRLNMIAFVQDDKTKQVLQAAMVPVEVANSNPDPASEAAPESDPTAAPNQETPAE